MFLEILEMIIDTMIKIFPVIEKFDLENLIKSIPGGAIFLVIIGIIGFIINYIKKH